MDVIENYTNKPERFWLSQNYPNPFNPETKIGYKLPKACEVTINIYNMKGQLVQSLIDQKQFAGNYSVRWNGKDYCGRTVTGGIYLGKIQAGTYNKTIRMILLK